MRVVHDGNPSHLNRVTVGSDPHQLALVLGTSFGDDFA